MARAAKDHPGNAQAAVLHVVLQKRRQVRSPILDDEELIRIDEGHPAVPVPVLLYKQSLGFQAIQRRRCPYCVRRVIKILFGLRNRWLVNSSIASNLAWLGTVESPLSIGFTPRFNKTDAKPLRGTVATASLYGLMREGTTPGDRRGKPTSAA